MTKKCVSTIEIGGLECAVGHVERNANGESKWYHHVGKKTEAAL